MICGLIASCKTAPNVSERALHIVSDVGEPLDGASYLAAPFAHGVMINNVQDSLHHLIIGLPTRYDRIEVEPIGVINLLVEKKEKQFVLSFPSDKKLRVSDISSFQDLVVKHNSMKVLIDLYLSNYLGFGQSRVMDWQNELIAQQKIDDFWSK